MTDQHTGQKAPAFTRLETLTAVAVVGLLGLSLGMVALFQPTETTVTRTVDFEHTGAFEYSADAPADSVYGPGGVSNGEPIVTDVAGPVTLDFDYRLTTGASADVDGTISMQATVTLPHGLTRVFPMAQEQEFSDGEAHVSTKFPVDRIAAFVASAQQSLGSAYGSTAAVVVEPRIKLEGALDTHPFTDEFAPELQFALDEKLLTVSGPDDEPTDATQSDRFAPTEAGSVDHRVAVAGTVPLLVAEPTAVLARQIGFGVAGAGLLIWLILVRPLVGSRRRHDEAARIQMLYGGRMVEVRELRVTDGPVADVASIEALADLAKRYESMIMHLEQDGVETYLVWDNGMTYRYRQNPTPRTSRYEPAHMASISDHDWQLLTELSTGDDSNRLG